MCFNFTFKWFFLQELTCGVTFFLFVLPFYCNLNIWQYCTVLKKLCRFYILWIIVLLISIYWYLFNTNIIKICLMVHFIYLFDFTYTNTNYYFFILLTKWDLSLIIHFKLKTDLSLIYKFRHRPTGALTHFTVQ